MSQDEEVAAILQGWADQIAATVLAMPEMQALALLAWKQKQAEATGEAVDMTADGS